MKALRYLIKSKKIQFSNFMFQRIMRLNCEFPCSIHFTSRVTSAKNIMVKGGSRTLKSFANSGSCYFSGHNGIIFGRNVLFAPGVKIISSNHNYSKDREPIKCDPIIIGDNVWLGVNVIVLPAVSIGENSIIGAGSLVNKSVPSNAICVGNPAKTIGWLCDCGCKLQKSNDLFVCNICSNNYRIINNSRTSV